MLPQPSFRRKDRQVCFQQDDLTASRAASVSDCASVSVTRESQRPLKWPTPLQPWSLVSTGKPPSLKQQGCKEGVASDSSVRTGHPCWRKVGNRKKEGNTDLRGTDHLSGAYQAFATCKFKSTFTLFLSQNGPFYRLGNRGSARLHKLPRTM